MTYIFMDESGDLTFHNIHGSCFFLITFLITSNEKDMKLVMKNLHSRMKGKKVKMKGSFFHATKEDPASIKRVLDLITRREIKIISMILDKSQYQDSEEGVHNLYNKIVGELLKECEKKHFFQDSRIQFIASRRETNKNLNQNFITTLQNYHSEELEIEILIKSPKDSNGLEVVDAISYALYKKYEENNLDYYTIIKNKILLEKKYKFS